MNYLEQLAAEWYEYSGYFVRTNMRANKLAGGGWKNEIDILAYKPKTQELIHVETSGGAESWVEINKKISKKFNISLDTYTGIIDAEITKLERLMICGWSKKISTERIEDKSIEIISIPDFLNRVIREVHKKDFMSNSISEGYPLLRTIQMMDRFYDKNMKSHK